MHWEVRTTIKLRKVYESRMTNKNEQSEYMYIKLWMIDQACVD
jgi:hypothetical protein